MNPSDYIKFDDVQKFYRLDLTKINALESSDLGLVVKRLNELNCELARSSIKNVSASEVVMSRNLDRSLIKKNISVRVPQDLVHAYMRFAGSLNVPVSDLFAYVLKYGFLSLREIKEI